MKRAIAFGLELTLACAIALLIQRNGYAVDADSSHASEVNDYKALLRLASKPGFTKLTDCEQKLLASLSNGGTADCRPKTKNDEVADHWQNDPSKGDSWPGSRQIHPELIQRLLVNEAILRVINSKGIRIMGAKILGERRTDPLDLSNLMVPFPIAIWRSRILSPISLTNANVKELDLSGTWTGPVTANGLTVQGDIVLRNSFHSDGDVRFDNANVIGNLNFEDATFNAKSIAALDASFIKVTGSIFLRGVHASGVVNLSGATVGGSLICDHGTFTDTKGTALNAERSPAIFHLQTRSLPRAK
jgi:hypothetical protein